MSKLQQASAQLERAVDRLDKALASSPTSEHDDHPHAAEGAVAAVERERDSLRADIDTLKSEQARLNEALKDARENYAAMRVVNEAVAGRLDDAIGKMRAILEV